MANKLRISEVQLLQLCTTSGYFKGMFGKLSRPTNDFFEILVPSLPGVIPYTAKSFIACINHLSSDTTGTKPTTTVDRPLDEIIHVAIYILSDCFLFKVLKERLNEYNIVYILCVFFKHLWFGSYWNRLYPQKTVKMVWYR